MSLTNTVAFSEIFTRGTISNTDVSALRRSFYDDGAITAEEAEQLFKLNDTCLVSDIDWADCFVEMLTDYVVHQVKPEGYVTAENASWLIARISKDGRIESKTELELAINIVDKARWCPPSLVTLALEQVKCAVINNEGPLRSGKSMTAGMVTESEVELLKRILYAFGGDGNIAITHTEASILCEINDATAGAENAESWRDLYVKAMANAVMSASGYKVPSREQALAREMWLERRGEAGPAAAFGSIIGSGLGGVLAAYRELSGEEQAMAQLERQRIEIITAEEVTPAEANWISQLLNRDGRLTPNELALVEFLKENSPKVASGLLTSLNRPQSAA